MITNGTCDMFTNADDTLNPRVQPKAADVRALDQPATSGRTRVWIWLINSSAIKRASSLRFVLSTCSLISSRNLYIFEAYSRLAIWYDMLVDRS